MAKKKKSPLPPPQVETKPTYSILLMLLAAGSLFVTFLLTLKYKNTFELIPKRGEPCDPLRHRNVSFLELFLPMVGSTLSMFLFTVSANYLSETRKKRKDFDKRIAEEKEKEQIKEKADFIDEMTSTLSRINPDKKISELNRTAEALFNGLVILEDAIKNPKVDINKAIAMFRHQQEKHARLPNAYQTLITLNVAKDSAAKQKAFENFIESDHDFYHPIEKVLLQLLISFYGITYYKIEHDKPLNSKQLKQLHLQYKQKATTQPEVAYPLLGLLIPSNPMASYYYLDRAFFQLQKQQFSEAKLSVSVARWLIQVGLYEDPEKIITHLIRKRLALIEKKLKQSSTPPEKKEEPERGITLVTPNEPQKMDAQPRHRVSTNTLRTATILSTLKEKKDARDFPLAPETQDKNSDSEAKSESDEEDNKDEIISEGPPDEKSKIVEIVIPYFTAEVPVEVQTFSTHFRDKNKMYLYGGYLRDQIITHLFLEEKEAPINKEEDFDLVANNDEIIKALGFAAKNEKKRYYQRKRLPNQLPISFWHEKDLNGPDTFEAFCNELDFTINALIMSPSDKKIKDPLNRAINDIRNKIINTIVPAIQSFGKDPLRILRAVKLASKLKRVEFKLSLDIINAIKNNRMAELLIRNKVKQLRSLPELIEVNSVLLQLLLANPRHLAVLNYTALLELDIFDQLFPGMNASFKKHTAWFQEALQSAADLNTAYADFITAMAIDKLESQQGAFSEKTISSSQEDILIEASLLREQLPLFQANFSGDMVGFQDRIHIALFRYKKHHFSKPAAVAQQALLSEKPANRPDSSASFQARALQS